MQLLINQFRNTKLAIKFIIIFILLGLGFTFMGFAYYKTIQSQEVSSKKAAELKDFDDLVDKIQLHILETNRNVKDFETAQASDDLISFNGKMNEIDQYLTEIKKLARSDKDKNFISKIESTTDQYQDDFYAAAEVAMEVGLFKDLNGLVGVFVNNVIQLTNSVVHTHDENVVERFFALRMAQDAYLKDNDVETPGQILVEQDRFLEAVSHVKGIGEANTLQLKAQTLAVVQGFENLNSSFEEQKQLFKLTEEQRLVLRPLLEQLLAMKENYAVQDQKLSAQTDLHVFHLFMASIVLVVLTFSLTAWILKRSVLKPIEITQQTIQQVSAGDTKARSQLEQRDELGLLATALDNLLDEKVQALIEKQAENEMLNDSIIEVIQSVFKLSQRDLTVLVPVAEDVTGALADSINLLTESMRNVLFNVQSVAVRVTDASNNMQSQSETVQILASQDQLEIQQTLNELNSAVQTMQRIAELAKVSNTASLKAMSTSVTAQRTVSQTIESINEIRTTIHQAEKKIKRLGERSQEIGGIVGLINNIAERTHLLSLNASMHAAAAGEAGKSLMVVVDEVQRLAENSREATAEISSLVNNIQLETADTINVINTVISNVVEGTKLAEQAGERMQETLDTTELLVESVDKISHDVLEQEKVAERLLNRANTLDESSKLTHQQMTQQTELSAALVTAAEELQTAVNVFKLVAA
jgi:twitching motility protein PilJ